jgi:hypothetical protein
MYILRAKAVVALADIPLAGIIGASADPVAGQSVSLYGGDRRQNLLGAAATAALATYPAAAHSEWVLADIRAGLPAIGAITSAEFVPQMVNLDLVDGISFSKGCYTGQEIVARMKYLGRVKRRMLRFATAGSPPPPGTALYAARGAAGQVVSSAPAVQGSEFLAVVVLDDLNGPLHLDETGLQPVLRQELPYEVPV